MTFDGILSRLRAGLDESEDAANFALELEHPYREMTDQAAEIRYEWVRHTRLSNGGSGSMFLDGAPTPKEVLRTVEAIRKVIAEYRSTSESLASSRGVIGSARTNDYSEGRLDAFGEVLTALASIYPADETEGTQP